MAGSRLATKQQPALQWRLWNHRPIYPVLKPVLGAAVQPATTGPPLPEVQRRGSLAGWELWVTQQYLIGQLSVLLEGLQPSQGERLADAVRELRLEVESCAPWKLAKLAHQAVDLSDSICWDALERGDSNGFGRYSRAAVALGEFTDSSRLLRG